MYRELKYKISSDYEGFTISDYLREHGYSRHIITHIKKTDMGILINGKCMYTNYKLHANEELNVIINEETSSENIVPVKMNIDIIYEDEDIIIINKTANMPIHPSINNYENTLANALAYYFKSQGKYFIFRCINRLDRDTSGLTIIAKNMLSASILSDMVKKREIKREYLAIVTGEIADSKTVDAPIARVEGSTIERHVDFINGVRAVTHYKPVISGKNYSLISLSLETGRTHQIRVHMKYIGHPLPGDFLYNKTDMSIKRQALHSYRLSFIHPITKQKMVFECALPDDMKKLVF